MDISFTTRSQEALSAAVRHAATAGHADVQPAHLALALLNQDDGTTRPLVQAVGADRSALITAVEKILTDLPSVSGATVNGPSLARATYAALSSAQQQATALGDEYVSTEHLLIGLTQDAGPVGTALRAAGVTDDAVRAALPSVRGNGKVTSPDP
jgi:ATP-dependent Clp protease ATP-binding subunit ClpB